jgi:hypothetical protein
VTRVLTIIIAGLLLGTLLFAFADGSAVMYVLGGAVFVVTTIAAIAVALRGL